MRPVLRSGILLGLLGLLVAGCGSDRDGPFGNQPVPPPAITGVVLDYTDTFLRDVPVDARGQVAGGTTRINGVLLIGPGGTGNEVLEVGDSVTRPTLLVPYLGDPEETFLERPIFLPDLESGIGANLPASVAAVTTIAGNELPGVTLRVDAGTQVSAFQGEIRVLPVSASRLPLPVRGGQDARSEPRVAYLVEPHGAQFSPPATLSVPRLEDGGGNPFQAYKVDLSSGEWVLQAGNLSPSGPGGETISFPVDEGTLYAVVAQTAPPTTPVTGRIVRGNQPVSGYRASCWNRVSDPTGADGTFTIDDVPTAYGLFLVRAYPERPGSGHAPELVTTTSLIPSLGDLQVAALPPDAIRPDVRRTSPGDGARNVNHRTQIVVTFSEAIDPAHPRPYRLIGRTGDVPGRLSFDNAFTLRFRPEQTLERGETYRIVIDPSVTDLAGNAIDDSDLTRSFLTRAGNPDPAPTDTQAFGLEPLSASEGESVVIPGRNYTGGSVVSFGSSLGLVAAESSDTIEVLVPGEEPAGDVTVSISAGGVSVATLQPLVLDLRAQVAAIVSGTTNPVPLVVVDRALPPAQIVIDGSNVGGTSVTVDGVSIAAVDSTVTIGGQNVATGRTIVLPAPAPPTLLSGPVVVRGANGRPGTTYRFLQVRE